MCLVYDCAWPLITVRIHTRKRADWTQCAQLWIQPIGQVKRCEDTKRDSTIRCEAESGWDQKAWVVLVGKEAQSQRKATIA